MNFSFKLLDLKCNSVLSSNNSPWGANDGIRVSFLAWTASGYNERIDSGREFPPPDLVDNYWFVPGKALDLNNYPPSNKSSWETDPIDVGDTDNVWLAVIGVNEGLPWVGGGGGGGLSGLFLYFMEEFVKDVVGGMWKQPDIYQAPTEAAVSTGFEGLNRGLAALNNSDDCSGVAFAYETVFSARYLFSEHVAHTSTVLKLDKQALGRPLAIINDAFRSPGCGQPDYEATLLITLRDQLMVRQTQTVADVRMGVPRTFTPVFEHCAPAGEEILVWPVIRDLVISLQPNFSWPTMIWKIEDHEIHEPRGVLPFNKPVAHPPDTGTVTQNVNVGFEVSDVGGANRLTLWTKGTDGNYTLTVALLLKFFDNQPPVLFWEEDLYVQGELLTGNDAYAKYADCVRRLMASFRDIAIRYVEVQRRLEPGTPVERILGFERDMGEIARLLRWRSG